MMSMFDTLSFHPDSSLRFATLYSGSSGNAVYIKSHSDEILIDEGKSTKCTEAALQAIGSSLSNISAIFVTHEHHDHTAGLPVTVGRYGIPVYLPALCADMLQPMATACPMEPLFTVTVGEITVRSFLTPHDSVMSVGYIVETPTARLGIATDMGFLCKEVVAELQGCDAAIVESNYDPDMLRYGTYPAALKARILSNRGHLANCDGALLAAVLAKTGTKRILLGHLSKENNTPKLAYAAAEDELARRGVSAELAVAERDCPTILL